jgi:hypothetical protein
MESWCLMTATNQHDRPPAPGSPAELAHRGGDTAGLTAPTEERVVRQRGRGNPVSIVLGKLMSALRGDKYMVDAYPAAGREDATAPDPAFLTPA